MRTTIVVLLSLAASVRAELQAQEPAAILEAPGLRDYVHAVLERNAGYRAATLEASAAGQRIAPAGALPDPIVTTGVMALPVPSLDFTAERMTRVPIGISQYFPFPGKQDARTDAARADSALIAERAGAVETHLAFEAARAWFDLARSAAAVEVWRRRIALADQAVTITQSRYATGQAEQVDAIRARLRRAELLEELSRLEANTDAARYRLLALLGTPQNAPATEPSSLLRAPGSPALVPDPISEEPDSLLIRLVADSAPELAVAAARVERARREARVFAVAALPDFTVSVENGVRFGGREPFLTALVGISIPLWSGRKQAPAARAAAFEAEAAAEDYADRKARLEGEVLATLADLRALGKRIASTTTDIIPLAGAAGTSSLQRYRVGAVGFTTVLDAQDALARAELHLANLIADYGTTRAALSALVGEEWYR